MKTLRIRNTMHRFYVHPKSVNHLSELTFWGWGVSRCISQFHYQMHLYVLIYHQNQKPKTELELQKRLSLYPLS